MAWERRAKPQGSGFRRLIIVRWLFVIFAASLVIRVGWLQIAEHKLYAALADDQHKLSQQLTPTRGQIFVHDDQDADGLYPMATNKTLHLLYAIPAQISDPVAVATALQPLTTVSLEELLKKLSKKNDFYEPLQHNLTDEQQSAISALSLPGIEFSDETSRYYPEKNIGSQLIGFVGSNGTQKVGRYGVESAFEKLLAGTQGYIKASKDASGNLIASGAQFWEPAVDGSDVVLTINRAVEYEACRQLDEWVELHGASGGSVVITNPTTGAIIAMCGNPDFDPNAFNTVTNVSAFANAATQDTYEPGSVFKPLTMAAAINEEKVTPETTYTDTGSIKVGSFTIKNSDNKAHGVQTMNQVLEESLNTGAIFAMQQVGPGKFYDYLQGFGFGTKTGFGLSEGAGNISALKSGKEIYAMTGSFGQGLTVSVLQLTNAYAALANGGKLMKPYVIDQIRTPDGKIETTKPEKIRDIVSPKTASTIGAMLVNVVEKGHGKRAGVPGYYVAGKTGTAQIPDPNGSGYLENVTIGTFAGFAPVEDPKFAMVVRVDRPKDVQYAESSAAPLFGKIAKFLLSYYHVAPTRK
jgi:cell division protein FtsI/penicillin-binding protein 2